MPDPKALPSAVVILEAFNKALAARDMPAVAALLRLLAVVDPQAAELILTVVREEAACDA